jgi:hypothetical protein
MELHDNDPDRLLGDKGYDSDNIRNDLAERGIVSVIPPRSNRKVLPSHRHTLRENRQSLSFDAMYCVRTHLDQNCQHGLDRRAWNWLIGPVSSSRLTPQ